MEWVLIGLARGRRDRVEPEPPAAEQRRQGYGGFGGRTAARRPSAEELEAVRRAADEDVTQFGEELQRLDTELGGRELDEGTRQDYQRALDAYEEAKESSATLCGARRRSSTSPRSSTTAGTPSPACGPAPRVSRCRPDDHRASSTPSTDRLCATCPGCPTAGPHATCPPARSMPSGSRPGPNRRHARSWSGRGGCRTGRPGRRSRRSAPATSAPSGSWAAVHGHHAGRLARRVRRQRWRR